jgi:WD40 repeat protein
VELSKDGSQVLTADIDETVLWDAVTGREVRRFLGSGGTFSPNGKQVLTGGRENTARVWDLATGREVRRFYGGEGTFSPDGKLAGRRFFDAAMGILAVRFTGYTETVSSVALSLDGEQVLTSSSDNTVRVWDVATGRELRRFYGGEGTFSPDDKQVLIGSYDNTVGSWDVPASAADKIVRLWDVTTGREVRRFIGHADRVDLVAFSPDGTQVLTGSQDKTARLWDAATGHELHAFGGHTANILSIAFSTSGKQILTEGRDSTLRVWEVATGRELRRFFGGKGKFSLDGKHVLTSSSDNTVRLWDVDTGLEVRRYTGHTDTITSIALSSNGKQVLAGSRDKTIALWDVDTGRELRSFAGQTGGANLVAFSPDGKQMIVSREDNSVSLWDVSTGLGVRRFRGHSATILSAVFSPDSKRVLTSSSDNTVRLWDVATGQELRRFADYTSTVTSAVFSSDGTQMLTGGRDNTGGQSVMALRHGGELILPGEYTRRQWSARLYDLATGREVWRIVMQAADLTAITSAALSPDGKQVLTSNVDDVVRLWDASTGKEVRRFYGTNGIFSPNGKEVLVGGGRENEARIENIDTGVQKVRHFSAHTNTVLALAFSPDGKQVLTGSRDNTARLWDAATGQELRAFLGHTDAIRAVAFSPDGKQVTTSSADSTVRVWDVATGQQLCSLFSFRDGGRAVVDAAGRFDADSVDQINGFSWVFPDDPFRPLPPEIFLRDYYEPRLLPRLLAGEELPKVRPLADLNRVQPDVKIVSVKRGAQSDLAEVVVDVSATEGRFQRDGKPITMRTAAYDLRLFREGQLVGQDPELSAEAEASLKNGVLLSPLELKEWQTARRVKPVTDRVRLDSTTGKLQRTFTVRLPHGQAGKEIGFSAYAFNEDRVKSETAPGSYKVPLDVGSVKRRAYVVAMGVNAYENSGWDLRFAASDAKLMREALTSRLENQKYEVVPVSLVSDCKQAGCPKDGNREIGERHATKAGLHAVLELLAGHALSEELKKNLPPGAEKIRKAEPDDLVVLSVSSHGYTSKEGMFYIVPSDSGQTDGHGLTEELRKKWISSDELSAWLRGVDAGDLVMIVDTCHSAATVEEPGFKPGPMGSRGLGQLAYDKGMRILAASQADDVALESERLKQGLLTYALVHDGLGAKQAVKAGTKEVTLDSWLEYGSQRVPPLYQEVLKGQVQTFAAGSKDVRIDEQLSGGTSTLKKPASFQQPSLFNFQKNKQDLRLQ